MPSLRIVLLALALASTAPAAAQGVGEGFDVLAYDLDLRPDLETGAVSARQAITFEATGESVDRLVFSPNALTISEARLGDQPVRVLATDTGIVFLLPQALPPGESARLEFTLAGMPARGVTLLPTGLSTGYFACDWMVCLQDAPGDKADLALNLYLPAGADSLGVGQLREVAPVAGGMAVHRWHSDAPTSPYLIAFAAGHFPAIRASTPYGELRFVDGTGNQADLANLFAQTEDMVAFFSDRAGLPLPPSGYAQLLVPGDEAQEAASFSLIGLDHLEAEADNPASAWVIAHELAHQWWGNAVTTQTWADFWLNEGITTFMVAAWREQAFGVQAYRDEVARLEARRARLEETGWDMPLAWPGRYPSLGVRRAVQYSKGALFMVRLRELVGEEAFWRGLRAYTQAHAGGTVTSRDFQAAIEAASGRDLSAMFDEWVYPSGRQALPPIPGSAGN